MPKRLHLSSSRGIKGDMSDVIIIMGMGRGDASSILVIKCPPCEHTLSLPTPQPSFCVYSSETIINCPSCDHIPSLPFSPSCLRVHSGKTANNVLVEYACFRPLVCSSVSFYLLPSPSPRQKTLVNSTPINDVHLAPSVQKLYQ